ncbi:actin interacting protein 3-domain-containing protein [Cyathus striatus]|nr:actin interacting protein 3-domain-containing protein [Cyathus striatus]
MSSRPAVSSTGSYGHASRRDNHSISSNHSSSSRTERGERERNARQGNHPAVESTVTRLLVSIKVLLEALTNWSELKVDENHVSDVYVQLGNDFNAAVAAFTAFNIDMSELLAVPEDLRTVLEQCLSEDATKENLEIYLPDVRRIITNLLQGLRGKQSIYRKIVSDHRHKSGESNERMDSRNSRGSRSHRSQLSRSTIAEDDRTEAGSSGSGTVNGSIARRSAQVSTRRRHPDSQSGGPGTINEEPFIGGFAPNITQQSTQQLVPSLPEPQLQQETQHTRQRSRAGSMRQSPPLPAPPTEVAERKSSPLPPEPPSEQPATPPAYQASVVPASVKRYSLVDKPIAPTPEVLVEPSSPKANEDGHVRPTSPPSDIIIESSPVVASSLAALKNSDVLERRASKRFSTYNISKMTGATTRERSLRGHPNRRSLAASSALTPGELAVLTEVDDEENVSSSKGRDTNLSARRPSSRPTTPQKHQDTPPVPPVPVTPSRTPEPPVINGTTEQAVSEISGELSRFTVFLQVGREVKKVTVEPGISFAALRVLFVDRFSYNPGQENFPAIYIRDPSSGVLYELEDTDEVKDKCLLSLNIEPLDQIKQHIDSQISSLSQDIKDLKTTIASNNANTNTFRPPSHIPDIPVAESTPAPTRPSDRQFQHVARRLSRFMGDASPSIFEQPFSMSIQPQFTGMSLQPQMTGASVLSDYTSRVVTDLKTQFDEVQNLRRDLGVMRQLYTEFMKQTKDSLGNLRTQTQSVKQLATSHVGGARAYIDSGKKKLDVRSQNVLTEVEKLQDAVENVKDDVIKRQITPKGPYFKNIRKDVDSVAAELESLKEHIQTIKPMWKKTWEEELQNIVEEQQFLTHQEEFLNDLLEDHKSVVEIYEHIAKVISLRGSAPRKSNFRPPVPDEGHTGLSTVMMEIRGAAVDPEKRLKAIEASQRTREKEKAAARTGELQAEITDFVGQKKLKMTGGAEEAERVRQKRNEQTLKAMFTGGSVSPSVESHDINLSSM